MKRLNSLIAGLYGLASVLAFVPAPAMAQSVTSQYVNAQTGTTYTFTNSDCSRLVTFANAASIAATLPQAGASHAFIQGCFVDVMNTGLGAVVITPTTSTINGLSAVTLQPGSGMRIVSTAAPSGAGTGNYVANGFGSGGGAAFSTGRNLIRNGAINVASYGTSVVTGSANAGSSATTYAADGWWISTNVGSGDGRGQVITATPSPPTGFTNSLKVFRNSGALTQPVCAIQEIPSAKVVALQGQTVVLSYLAQALAGLSADNSNVITANIITGTGTDEGMGSVTASPAITPAFTGVATAQSVNQTITTGWVRYSTAPITIATTVKEIAVAMCFTPTATGAGSTDGFAMTGIQLEAGSIPTSYEYLSSENEKLVAQQYVNIWADGAATRRFPATCVETTANTTAACTWVLPTTMRAVPTIAVTTATSFGVTKSADGTAVACTTLAAIATSATTTSFGLTCASTQTTAVGLMEQLIGAATGATNLVTAWADF